MKNNIYVQIYNILSEYENLLSHVRSNNTKETKSNTNPDNVQDNFMDDDFMAYIFNNIKVKKKETHIINENTLQLEDDISQFNNFYSQTSYEDEHNSEENNIEPIQKNTDIEIFMKKYYKKIIILTHPDKTSDKLKNEIFMKAKLNLENKFLIGIIKNCYDLKINIDDLTDIIMNQIIDEIRMIQEKIIELKKTYFID